MTSPLKVRFKILYLESNINIHNLFFNQLHSYSQVKVVLLGEAGVGKTCLVQRYAVFENITRTHKKSLIEQEIHLFHVKKN